MYRDIASFGSSANAAWVRKKKAKNTMASPAPSQWNGPCCQPSGEVFELLNHHLGLPGQGTLAPAVNIQVHVYRLLARHWNARRKNGFRDRNVSTPRVLTSGSERYPAGLPAKRIREPSSGRGPS